MALRWVDGFENHRSVTMIRHMYETYSGSSLSGTVGRKIGQCVNATGNAQWTTPSLVSALENTWIIQWAVRKSVKTTINGTPGIEVLDSGNGIQLELRMINGVGNGNFRYEVFRGASSLGVTADFQWGDRRAWHVFQLKVVVRTSTNGSVELKHWDYYNNATTALNLTTINTSDQGTDGADQFRIKLQTQTSANLFLDDVIIMDSTGSVNNNLTSVPALVYGQLPASDGATLDWIPSGGGSHASHIDEGAEEALDGNDLTSATPTDLDQFLMTTSPLDEMPAIATPTILGMQIDTVGAMRNSGTRTVRINIDDPLGGNADVAGQDLVWANLIVDSRVVILEQNPVSVAAWTRADLLDHIVGIKVIS